MPSMELTSIWLDDKQYRVESIDKTPSGAIISVKLAKETPTRQAAEIVYKWRIARDNKIYRESRVSYRLKQWFLSLRVVNNIRWRRENKTPRNYMPVLVIFWCGTSPRNLCDICSFPSQCHDNVFEQMTKLLPDYPSITALEQREVKT